MDPIVLACAVLAAVLALIVARVPIAFALALPAAAGVFLFFSWRPGGPFEPLRGIRPTLSVLASSPYDFVTSYELSMIPLFIGLGFVASRAGITTDLYYALRVWLARVPGGLAMASVLGCGGFSAISGSSVACASAMGRIALPEMLKYGYDRRLATGALAAGGTLGSLIPPSLLFVIYAIFTEQSVKNLFLAGIGPGLLSLAGYLLTVWIWCRRHPEAAPMPKDLNFARADRMRALRQTWPAVLLLAIITIGIYRGLFTPTEAAAVSLFVAVLIGFARRTLDLSTLFAGLRETVLQTCAIFLIAIGAKVFVSLISLTRLAPVMIDWLQGTGAGVVVIIAGVVLLYLLLGMILDSIGILVLTLPFTVPLVEGYGLNLIWFGVVVVKLLEIGLVTPPVGLNVFVIKSVAPREVSLETVFQGVAWFLVLDFVVLLAILLVPEISLLIPRSAS